MTRCIDKILLGIPLKYGLFELLIIWFIPQFVVIFLATQYYFMQSNLYISSFPV